MSRCSIAELDLHCYEPLGADKEVTRFPQNVLLEYTSCGHQAHLMQSSGYIIRVTMIENLLLEIPYQVYIVCQAVPWFELYMFVHLHSVREYWAQVSRLLSRGFRRRPHFPGMRQYKYRC